MKVNREVILYVDDEALNCFVFERCFRKYFEVVTVRCPLEGLSLLAERPEIRKVVTDYKMPRMNGLEFVESAQRQFEGKTFYMLSGFEPSELILEALHQGIIRQYFQKPLDRDLILSHLQ